MSAANDTASRKVSMPTKKHQPISAEMSAWMIALADPLGRCSLPSYPLRVEELPAMLDAASAHGVKSALTRNLGTYVRSDRARELPRPQEISQLLENEVVYSKDSLARQAKLEQELTIQSNRIAATFDEARIGFAMVKGDRFSRRLYPHPEDRPYGDIDILIPVSDLRTSRDVLPGLGFKLEGSRAGGGDSNTMDKWVLTENHAVTVEVQTNLVHSRRLAKTVGLSYQQLLVAGRGNPEDGTALLFAAAVHAAAIHQMDRLQHVIDVLQTVRGSAGKIDVESLQEGAREAGATAAVQTALDVAYGMFGEDGLRQLADRLTPAPLRKMRQILLTPRIVTRARSTRRKRDNWRRRIVRAIISGQGKQNIGRSSATASPTNRTL